MPKLATIQTSVTALLRQAGSTARLVAKIERQVAVDNLRSILVMAMF